MQNGVTTVCDACMQPVDGIYGTAKVKKQYISIRGTICLKAFDKNMIPHFTYAQPSEYAGRDFLQFCNGACLDDFMKVKVMLKGEYHDEKGLEKVDYLPPEEVIKRAAEEKPGEKPPVATGFFNDFKY